VNAADRELRAEGVIAAAPEAVWAVLADTRRMPELSEELVRMVPLLPGGLRVGQNYLGINRRRAVLWPTRSVVAELEPGRRLTWDTTSSGARWVWELSEYGDGQTRVVHRRPVPRRLTRLSGLFAAAFLGGVGDHADELEAGMATSIARLRSLVERDLP
jgi:uncharacterized protein YndB with AHSA1/START domain